MGIGFLVPAFLAGLAALAIPLLMHLRHRDKDRPYRFPSLMFLEQLPIRTSQRQRITDWPLLLLRALAVAALVFAFESGFLTIQLPSGRKLFYVKPRIEAEDLVRETSAGGKFVVARAGSLTYEGQDQKTKQWTRLSTYGGKLVENITQAVARDCLAESMLARLIWSSPIQGLKMSQLIHDFYKISSPLRRWVHYLFTRNKDIVRVA